MKHSYRLSHVHASLRFVILLLVLSLAACSPALAQPPVMDATAIFENALLTATYAVTGPTAVPTQTPLPPTPTTTPLPPTPTWDPIRTPPALPAVFTSEYTNRLDAPRTYVQDTCSYLKLRWDPNNSLPGTVVMPIMFHSITDAETAQGIQITHDTLMALAHNLKDQGFEAITMQQLRNFLVQNAKIPERSVILIVDDRHYAEYFETHFKPIYEEYGWPVINAWISVEGTLPQVIEGNVRLQNEGWVDHQAHGVIHNVNITRDSSEEYMRSELFGSISTIQSVYGTTPIAYIWPGGSFTPRAAEIAQEAGFELGFTVNPRGPLMFNWIPLGTEADPARPSYIPENEVANPLLVLPRYWDQDASMHIDAVRVMGKEARAYAEQNRAIELEYYDIVCQPLTGPIPGLTE